MNFFAPDSEKLRRQIPKHTDAAVHAPLLRFVENPPELDARLFAGDSCIKEAGHIALEHREEREDAEDQDEEEGHRLFEDARLCEGDPLIARSSSGVSGSS